MLLPRQKRVSDAGTRTLLNVADGHGAWHGITGMSSHGGHLSTLFALRLAGLLTHENTLTVEGRAMVERLKTGKG